MSDLELKSKMLASRALMEQQLQRAWQTTNRSEKALQEASEDFEALFVHFLLRTMRRTVMKSGLLDTGLQGDVMQALFDQELSRQIARSTRLGIAEMVQQQLQRALPAEAEDRQFVASVHKPVKSERAIDRPPVHRLRPFEAFIEKAARVYNLDANLIRSVILAESSGNPRAISPKGAKGLMQLMDATARQLGVDDPFNPEENVLAGSAYLAKMLSRFGGDLTLALAAYNAGPSTVQKYRGIPPFVETRRYIRKVLSFMQYLKER